MANAAIEPLIKNAWYVAAWSHELGDKPLARKLLGEDVVLFRTGAGNAAALEDRCCHRAVKLSLGKTVENGVMCGYHGMVFDCAGKCIGNPGEMLNPNLKVQAYPVVERQQFVWIWMGDPALADESLIVDFPFHEQTDQWNFKFAKYDISANYMLMIDNLMDLTHLGYVHVSTIGGNPSEHDDAELETKRTDKGAHYVRWMMASTPPPSFVSAAGFKGKVDRWQDFEYVAPASVLQWGGGHDAGTGGREDRNIPGGIGVRLFHHATPADETNFYYFFSTAVRGKGADDPANEKFHQDILEAFLEDKLFLESQQESISKDPSRPLILRGHDKAVAYARQAVRKMQTEQNTATSEAPVAMAK
ncbi:MAG: Rieske 2Fe-2S domain-containing protein [Burkholderiaceae bacterium]